jgi:hypothetical protein
LSQTVARLGRCSERGYNDAIASDATPDLSRTTPPLYPAGPGHLHTVRRLRATDVYDMEATTYEPHLRRAVVRLLYDRFDQQALAERLVTDFASHIYFPAELELLFLSAGFEIARQYGDYRFVPVDRTSPHVVTVARRPRRSGYLCGSFSRGENRAHREGPHGS